METLDPRQVGSGYGRRWIAISALGLSLFMSALDATIVALALPAISSHFQLSESGAALLFLSYAIPLTLLILPSGSIINRFSALPLFAASVLGFGVGSLLCGIAPNLFVLLTGRVIQGSSAALMSTQGFALAGAIVSEKERGRAIGVIGTIAPLGGVAGPGIGGLLLGTFGWSLIFFVNLPVCVLAMVLGAAGIRGYRLPSRGKAGGSAYRQMLGLLRQPRFVFGLIAFMLGVTASVALYYVLPFDLNGVQGFGPALSGAVLLSIPLGMMMMGIVGGYLTDRYSPRPFILAGAALILVGSVLLSLVVAVRTSELDLSWRLLLIGGGIGLFSSPNSTVIIGFGGREAMGAASSLLNFSARLGTVIGPVVLGLAWASVASLSGQVVVGVLLVDGLAVLTLLLASLSVRPTRPVLVGSLNPSP